MAGVVAPAGHGRVASTVRQQVMRSQRPFCASARRQQAAISALSSTVRLAGVLSVSLPATMHACSYDKHRTQFRGSLSTALRRQGRILQVQIV